MVLVESPSINDSRYPRLRLFDSVRLAAYVVYAGFDEIGDKNEKKLASTTKKPAPRQQQMSHGL
jgi:hypothetical protein